MEKDFENWNALKVNLNRKEREVFCNPREIWICSIGANVGSEEDGKNENFARPVLIFKVLNENMFWGIPFTSKMRKGKFFYPVTWNGQKSVAKLSQLRVLSPKRLERKLAVMSEGDFSKLRDQVMRII